MSRYSVPNSKNKKDDDKPAVKSRYSVPESLQKPRMANNTSMTMDEVMSQYKPKPKEDTKPKQTVDEVMSQYKPHPKEESKIKPLSNYEAAKAYERNNNLARNAQNTIIKTGLEGLDLLGRPANATVNVLKATTPEKPDYINVDDKLFQQYKERQEPESISDKVKKVGSAFVKGLTGEERPEPLEAFGYTPEQIEKGRQDTMGKFLTGYSNFIAGNLLDPTNYIGAGAVKNLAAKMFKKIPGTLATKIAKGAVKVSDIAEALGKTDDEVVSLLDDEVAKLWDTERADDVLKDAEPVNPELQTIGRPVEKVIPERKMTEQKDWVSSLPKVERPRYSVPENKPDRMAFDDSLPNVELEKVTTEPTSKTVQPTNNFTPENTQIPSAAQIDSRGVQEVKPTLKMEDRTISNVGDKKVNAYQYDHPEVKGIIQTYANHVLNNEFIDNMQNAMPNEVTKKIREYAKGATADDIRKALKNILNNEGAENYATAKRVEMALDDLATNGFKSVDGTDWTPDVDYLATKSKIEGKEVKPVTKFEAAEDMPLEAPFTEYAVPKYQPETVKIPAKPEKLKDTDQIGIAGINSVGSKNAAGNRVINSPDGQAVENADGTWDVTVKGKTTVADNEQAARSMVDSGMERTEVKAKPEVMEQLSLDEQQFVSDYKNSLPETELELTKHIDDLNKQMATADEPTKEKLNLQLFAADEKLKEISRFRTNTIERSVLLQDAKEFLPEDVFKFDKEKVKDWEESAALSVMNNPELAKQKILKARQIDAVQEYEAAMISGQLLKQAEKTGDYGELTNWLTKVAERTRESARAMKAVDTAWEKSPEKVLKKAAQVVEENKNPDIMKRVDEYIKKLENGTIKPKDIKLLDALKTGNSDLLRRLVEVKFKVAIPDNLAKELVEDARKLQEMSDKGFQNLMDRTELMARINFKMNSLKTPTLGERITTFNYIQQLFNSVTQIRNILGNEAMYRGNRMAKYFATAIDFGKSKFFGADRTISFAKEFNPWKNVKQFTGDFWKGAKSGYEGLQLYGVSDIKFFGSGKKFTSKWNPLNYMEGLLGASLKGFDYAAYMRGTRDAVYELAVVNARNQGIKGIIGKDVIQKYMDDISKEALDIAEETGRYLTLQNKNKVSTAMNQMKFALNNIGIGKTITKAGQETKEFGVGNIVMNYSQSTGALIKGAFDFSPGGIVESMVELMRPLISKTGLIEKPTAETYKRMVESFSRGIVGTLGLTGMGYHLASVGIITGTGLEDKEAAAMDQKSGFGKNKINLTALYRYLTSGFNKDQAQPQNDDFIYTYDWLQPFAMSINVGANLQANIAAKDRADKGMSNSVLTALEGATQAVTEQPALTGITKFARGYDTAQNLKDMGQSLVTGMTGTYLNQIRKMTDNIKRNTNDNNPAIETINMIKNKMPWLSKKLPEVYTTSGEAAELYQGGNNNPLIVLFSPGFVSRYKTTPGTQLLLDLYKQTGETKQFPREVGKSITYNVKGESKKVNLTPEETGKLQELVGKRTIYMLELYSKDMTLDTQGREIKMSRKFSTMNADDKIEAIYTMLNRVGAYGRTELKKMIGKEELEKRAK